MTQATTTLPALPADGAAITPRNRKSLWRTAGAEIAALVAFVIVTQILFRAVDIHPTGNSAIAWSLLLAGIPAAIWMAFFYAQDRTEPEPLRFIALVGCAAGLLAVGVGQPLITKSFGVSEWIGRSAGTQILGGILVIGFVQEFCKYVAIRATVYETGAINQRVDGVVYGAAAGVGYATALNVSTVLSVGGFTDLRAGVIRIVATSLTHGSLGALIGYAAGRQRLENKPFWHVPAVLTFAAVVNGLSSWLRQRVSDRSISLTGDSGAQPARGLVLQCIIAIALLAVVLVLVRRADQKVFAVADRERGNLLPLVAAAGLTALALGFGLLQRNAVLNESQTASLNGATVKYPATWGLSTAETELQARHDGAGGYQTTLTLRSIKVDSALSDSEAIEQASTMVAVERGTNRSSFKVFDLDGNRNVNGKPSAVSRFAYTVERGSFLQESLPVVVTGDDTFVRSGDTVSVMTLETPASNRTKALRRYRQFVSSIRFTKS
jgi:RsiW-degrading membrane proteinase PrsW (M82 family)